MICIPTMKMKKYSWVGANNYSPLQNMWNLLILCDLAAARHGSTVLCGTSAWFGASAWFDTLPSAPLRDQKKTKSPRLRMGFLTTNVY